jgi:hypothetical protein
MMGSAGLLFRRTCSMAINTIGRYGIIDISIDSPEEPELPKPSAGDPIRIYMPAERTPYGRRSKQNQMMHEWEPSYAMHWLKREIAFSGLTGVPEARLWGKVIHGVGFEEGLMAVHLRPRYNF